MTGLRFKLFAGFGGLLLVLLTVSVLANVVLVHHSRANERMVREDLGSLAAIQSMTDDALVGIDADLQELMRQGPTRDLRTSALAHAADFERALARQRDQATLPHEPEETAELSRQWAAFRAALDRFLDPATPAAERRALYDGTLAPGELAMRRTLAAIGTANMQGIRDATGGADAAAARARWAMHALTAAGVAVAAAYAVLIGRMILAPVRAVTASAHEVAAGNLDLTVPVASRDELGRLAGAFNDMAAQLRAFRRTDRETLARTRRTTQLAIDSLPDGVVVIDPGGTIEVTNAVAARVFGLRPGTAVGGLTTPAGRRIADLHDRVTREGRLVQPGGYPAAIRAPAEDPAGGPGGPGDDAGAAPPPGDDDDAAARYFLPKAVPILDEDRRPIGSTVLLADVTEFRRLDRMKNGLLGLVSHELKTPLTSMRMILPLLLDGRVGPVTPRQRELLAAARDDADRLHRIVENLMDMARIESGRALMELRPAAVADLVRDAAEALAPTFAEHGVRLELPAADPAACPAAAAVVLADPTRVRHVLANLLGNALRYTPAGGRVTVSARRAPGDGAGGGDGDAGGSAVELSVADTGTGIPAAYLDRVFEKFFRVPGQPGDSGSGLGLAIVKDVVEAHGGRVAVESTEGQGATFRFTLRAATPAGGGGEAGGNHDTRTEDGDALRNDGRGDDGPGDDGAGDNGSGNGGVGIGGPRGLAAAAGAGLPPVAGAP
ncbi:MAG TPA: ATP-binding protein [Humisphaera sp.]